MPTELRGCRRVVVFATLLNVTTQTGGRDPPVGQCGRKNIIEELLNHGANPTRCRQPPLNSVRLVVCYIIPQGCFYAHVVQGGGAATCDTTAMFLSYLQRTFLGEVRAPDEEDGGHHAQKN